MKTTTQIDYTIGQELLRKAVTLVGRKHLTN